MNMEIHSEVLSYKINISNLKATMGRGSRSCIKQNRKYDYKIKEYCSTKGLLSEEYKIILDFIIIFT